MKLTPPRAWTLVACLAFLLATAYAIAVVAFRLPFLAGEHGNAFRMALALHVELAVFVWLMATMAGQWAASRGPDAPLWPAAVAVAGTILLASSPLVGGAPIMADYFPWLSGNAVFAAGFAIFGIAILAASIDVLRGPVLSSWRGVELAALPTLAAAVTLLVDALAGARDVATLAWGAGHVLLFAHVIILCRDWAALLGVSHRHQHIALLGLAAVGSACAVIPVVVAPGTLAHREAFTFVMAWLLWPPAVLLGAWTCLQLRSRKARPQLGRLAIGISFGLLLIGCLLGALIQGETTLVTAHYHAAVGAVAVSRMAVAYLTAAETAFMTARWPAMRGQLLTYSAGLVLLAGGLAVGAIEGAPRKTSAGELAVHGPLYKTGMSISGVGGLFAMFGAAWLVVNLLCRPRTITSGKIDGRRADGGEGNQQHAE